MELKRLNSIDAPSTAHCCQLRTTANYDITDQRNETSVLSPRFWFSLVSLCHLSPADVSYVHVSIAAGNPLWLMAYSSQVYLSILPLDVGTRRDLQNSSHQLIVRVHQSPLRMTVECHKLLSSKLTNNLFLQSSSQYRDSHGLYLKVMLHSGSLAGS